MNTKLIEMQQKEIEAKHVGCAVEFWKCTNTNDMFVVYNDEDEIIAEYPASKNTLFYIEVTDCYAGEPNYSWVTRHVIRAKNIKGAVNRFSRLSGMQWRKNFADMYKSKSGATCYFISEYDAECHADYNFDTDER